MKRRTRVLVAGAAVLIAAGTATGIAAAGSGGDDNERQTPIAGSDLDRASAAALEHTGGGIVTETEVGDEESYYEVEVRFDDGSQVDVQLDRDFRVVGDSPDEERANDRD